MITDEQVRAAVSTYHDAYHHHPQIMEDMRKALEAYEQSKWVEFDEYDGDTYPPQEQIVLLDTTHGLVSGWLLIEKNPCSNNPDDHYDTLFVCLDGIHEIEIGHVSRWQPLPEFKE